MRDVTLCLIIDKENNKILLGKKKRGFGKGKWNGYGGKLEEGETILDATIRETEEECGLIVKKENLVKYAEIEFYFLNKKEWNQKGHIYVSEKWEGEPKETKEMLNRWFNLSDIPYNEMWDPDSRWLPYVINENKKIITEFYFGEDNSTVERYNIKEITNPFS